MANPKVVVVEDDVTIMLTVPGAVGKACVYVSLERGRLVFAGGSSIVERIEGEGMKKKVYKT